MIDARFFKKKGTLTLNEISVLTKIPAVKSDSIVQDVASLEEAGPHDIACFHNSKYLQSFKKSKAGYCFVAEEFVREAPDGMVCLVTSSPYRAFGLTAQALYPDVDRDYESSDVYIHPTASIGEGCIIEPGVVVRRQAVIGDGTRVGAQSVIGPGVEIGKNCVIEPQVSVTHTLMGDHVTVLTGTRIGQAGFGFFMDKMGHIKIPQLGRVLIGNDVEIGANTTIDRGSMRDTIIRDGCRIDNLVQIAHNVELGKGCVIVSQVGISGSTRFGDHVIAAGQAGFAGHLSVESGAIIAAKSGVMKDIAPNHKVAGCPAVPIKDWHRQSIILSRLVKDSKLKKAAS